MVAKNPKATLFVTALLFNFQRTEFSLCQRIVSPLTLANTCANIRLWKQMTRYTVYDIICYLRWVPNATTTSKDKRILNDKT
jgi:hypothetical protein